MTELAFCPTCGIPWPNFCPLDGTRLSGPWSCKNAPKPVVRTPAVPAAAEAEPPRAQPAPRPAAPPPAAEAPAVTAAEPQAEPERPRRRADPDLVEALLGQAGARSSPAPTRGGGRRPREMSTTILPVVQPATPVPPAEPPDATDAPAKTTPAKKKKRAKGEFSDTQWFMKGKNLQVADPDTGTVVVDEEAYVVDESIPEEERRKFTLRKPEED